MFGIICPKRSQTNSPQKLDHTGLLKGWIKRQADVIQMRIEPGSRASSAGHSGVPPDEHLSTMQNYQQSHSQNRWM